MNRFAVSVCVFGMSLRFPLQYHTLTVRVLIINPGFKAGAIATALLSILTFSQSARCQDKKSPGKTVQSTKKPPEDRMHWKFLLDSLIVETRLVDPEDERPLVMADVADAYWLIDQQQSKKLSPRHLKQRWRFPGMNPSRLCFRKSPNVIRHWRRNLQNAFLLPTPKTRTPPTVRSAPLANYSTPIQSLRSNLQN